MCNIAVPDTVEKVLRTAACERGPAQRALLARWAVENNDRFIACVTRLLRRIYPRASAIDVEEVLAVKDLYYALTRYDHTRGAVAAFVCRIARNAVIDWRRKSSTRQLDTEGPIVFSDEDGNEHALELADPDRGTDPAELALRNALLRAIAECLEIQPARDALIVLAKFEGVSEQELATRLDCTLDTLKAARSRALARLANCLQDKGYSPRGILE